MRKTIITALILLTVLAIFAEAPIVTNVIASQRTNGSKIVDISYDVSDAENDDLWLEVLVSADGGVTFDIEPDEANVTGDFGSGIMPGTGKSITWNVGDETSDFDGDNFQLKVVAYDEDPTPPSCEDYDGNVYQTVQIDNQVWMAENLKVAHYRNGDAIPNITNNSQWVSTYTGVYDNTSANADTYGNLYNWYAVDDSRNIAPEGWHIPTDEEIKELEITLGMS
ncbi:MAG: fibrobacter succinogenes major paralogous domain-containing protein [Candidatus Cloacimonetes bacterium]|nr:fibrobacter succinogenes major paralogous domain-containing protein [Candidatus Cloacimonadota bacterium]